MKVANFGYLVRQRVETLSHATAIFRQVIRTNRVSITIRSNFPMGALFS